MTTIELASADGRVRAALASVGAALGALSVDGVDLIDEVAPSARADAAAGAVLFPWPNRVRDARWVHDGAQQQLVMTEPGRGTANHGFLLQREFALTPRDADHSLDSATLTAVVVDEPGFPFHLRLTLTYSLTTDGIAVTTIVTNDGDSPAPVALGFHPYLRVGDHAVDNLTLDLAASAVVEVDERLLPVGVLPVDDHSPWSGTRAIGTAELNDCLRSVARADRTHIHRLLATDGSGVEVRTSADLGWVQFYTHPDLPRPSGSPHTGRSLAVEPMSAPADALNSGIGLRWLRPGERWRTWWSMHRVAAGN